MSAAEVIVLPIPGAQCACGAPILPRRKGPKSARCEACALSHQRDYQASWRREARKDAAFAEKDNAAVRRSYAKNRLRTLAVLEARRNTPDGWIKYALGFVKQRAKAKGLEFNIGPEDLRCPDYCPVLGIRLERGNRQSSKDNSPSIERIDATRGYVKGNVVVISFKANRMKSNGTVADVERLLVWMKASGAP